MKTFILTLGFILMTLLPVTVNAEEIGIKECLHDIQTYWMNQPTVHLTGLARTSDAPCDVVMNFTADTFSVQAVGGPLAVSFQLKDSSGEETRTLQTCKVDKEKMHFLFELKTASDFEKRDRVQMTLLKRQGNGLSLILSKRENKILRPLQQSSLICHLK